MKNMNPQIQQIKQRFGIIGSSTMLEGALDTAIRVATTDLTVLITGESGVGKEVFSKVIHTLSARKHSDFIAINCGAIPEGTINSELFGHEKGSFTGAVGERKGYFETVKGGTIFLDEIGELPLDTQAFLLRVLENGEFIRVGSSKVEKTDVRIIAATNVNLEENMRNGKFREDLYYRLSTVPIKVPSLRERREDIYLLFRKFVNDFSIKNRIEVVKLDDRAQLVLENYLWPGNIRELKNIAERLCILSQERLINAEMLFDLEPKLFDRSLPSGGGRTSSNTGSQSTGFEEREILYKLLFDMKADLNDLKKLIFELVKRNDLHMPEFDHYSRLQTALPSGLQPNNTQMGGNHAPDHDWKAAPLHNQTEDQQNESHDEMGRQQMIIQPSSVNQSRLNHLGEVKDSAITMEEIEKEAIKKTLKKYNGRRKEAAEELKISERTLYRKIKEYDM
jgi:DNA-binding NtrC family response regulator